MVLVYILILKGLQDQLIKIWRSQFVISITGFRDVLVILREYQIVNFAIYRYHISVTYYHVVILPKLAFFHKKLHMLLLLRYIEWGIMRQEKIENVTDSENVTTM